MDIRERCGCGAEIQIIRANGVLAPTSERELVESWRHDHRCTIVELVDYDMPAWPDAWPQRQVLSVELTDEDTQVNVAHDTDAECYVFRQNHSELVIPEPLWPQFVNEVYEFTENPGQATSRVEAAGLVNFLIEQGYVPAGDPAVLARMSDDVVKFAGQGGRWSPQRYWSGPDILRAIEALNASGELECERDGFTALRVAFGLQG